MFLPERVINMCMQYDDTHSSILSSFLQATGVQYLALNIHVRMRTEQTFEYILGPLDIQNHTYQLETDCWRGKICAYMHSSW